MTARWTRALACVLTVVTGAMAVAPPANATRLQPEILNRTDPAMWLETPTVKNGDKVRVTFLVSLDQATFMYDSQGNFVSGVEVQREDNPWVMYERSDPGLTINHTTRNPTALVRLTFDPGDVNFRCGDDKTRIDKTFRFRVFDWGAPSAIVSATVTFDQDRFCPDKKRAFVTDVSQSAATAAPGEPVTFEFGAYVADRAQSQVDRVDYRWRRLADRATSEPRTTSSGATSLELSFPSRGRYVAEVRPRGGLNPRWWRVGTVDVNGAITASMALTGTDVRPGDVPSMNQGDSGAVTATVSAADTDGGLAQYIEWDADSDPRLYDSSRKDPWTDLAYGTGNVLHRPLDSSDLTQRIWFSTPGLHYVTARVTDNGAFDMVDDASTTAVATVPFRVNARPTAQSMTMHVAPGGSVTFTLAGADPDLQPEPLRYAAKQPKYGSVDVNAETGEAVYTAPTVRPAGLLDSFTYTVSDGPSTSAWLTSYEATVSFRFTL